MLRVRWKRLNERWRHGKAFLPSPRRFGGMKVQFGKRELDRFPVMRLENKLFVKIVPRELKLL